MWWGRGDNSPALGSDFEQEKEIIELQYFVAMARLALRPAAVPHQFARLIAGAAPKCGREADRTLVIGLLRKPTE